MKCPWCHQADIPSTHNTLECYYRWQEDGIERTRINLEIEDLEYTYNLPTREERI